MRRMLPPLTAAALGAAWLLAAPHAWAQATSPGRAPPAQAAPAPAAPAQVPEEKLDAAAAALERVVDLQETYRKQVAAAPADDKERIADEANDALEKAITEQGLSVDEYTSILEVAQNDPDVRQKLLQRIHPPSK